MGQSRRRSRKLHSHVDRGSIVFRVACVKIEWKQPFEACCQNNSNAMDDPYDLVLGMFALAVTAVMLVAGELYLVTRPEQPETYTPPASIVTSSIQ
jgi:hypothetical protein